MMMRSWMVLVVVAACGSTSPPSTGTNQVAVGSAPAGSAAQPLAGCMRQRAARHLSCIGEDRGDDNTEPVTICDGCVTTADCTARPGGSCVSLGGEMCEAPAAFVCRYPQDACTGCAYCSNDGRGGPACRNERPSAPPAMDDGN